MHHRTCVCVCVSLNSLVEGREVFPRHAHYEATCRTENVCVKKTSTMHVVEHTWAAVRREEKALHGKPAVIKSGVLTGIPPAFMYVTQKQALGRLPPKRSELLPKV